MEYLRKHQCGQCGVGFLKLENNGHLHPGAFPAPKQANYFKRAHGSSQIARKITFKRQVLRRVARATYFMRGILDMRRIFKYVGNFNKSLCEFGTGTTKQYYSSQ
jgi:hypothetical protein